MAIMVHITYKGSANNAQLFTNEMLDSGIIEKIRKNPGNLQYDYFIPISDPHSVLLIDCWKDQQALDTTGTRYSPSIRNDK